MIRRAAIGLLVCCSALAGVSGGGGFSNPQSAVSHPKSEIRKPRDYAPGVRIDWERQFVEVDAAVVLREGPLELLACSPNTREHESILVVQARPTHIYQAMGLIGLQPGSPVRYDPNTSRSYAPTGESLDLRVRYRQRGIEKTVKAGQWLLDYKRGQPPRSVEWVFAGSRTLDDGSFGADQDGTVVCVVDFATALIAPASLHTADNEFLWLNANTAVIPPIGTRCTLIIKRAAERTFAIVVDVAADGTLRREGKAVLATDLLRLLHREEPGSSGVSVVVRAATNVPEKVVDAAIESLVRGGISRDLLEVWRSSEKPPDTPPPGTHHNLGGMPKP